VSIVATASNKVTATIRIGLPFTPNTDATPTFSIFVTANRRVGFAPGTARVFVRFTDAEGAAHGVTSVAGTTD
jgi:hypothetical protein